MIGRTLAVFLLATLFSPASQAVTPTIRCDSCVSVQDFMNRARSGGIPGNVYVYSLASGAAHKYLVSIGQMAGGGESLGTKDGQVAHDPAGFPTAMPLPVETEVAEFFKELGDLYLALGESLHYSGAMTITTLPRTNAIASGPEGPPADDGIQRPDSRPLAYGFLADGIFHNDVMDGVRAEHANDSRAELIRRVIGGNVTVSAGLTLGLILSDQASVDYRVTLADGSRFRVGFNRQTGDIEVAHGSVRDPGNNTVPDRGHGYPEGAWKELAREWQPTSVADWLAEAQRQGIPTSNSGGSRVRCGEVDAGPFECWTLMN